MADRYARGELTNTCPSPSIRQRAEITRFDSLEGSLEARARYHASDACRRSFLLQILLCEVSLYRRFKHRGTRSLEVSSDPLQRSDAGSELGELLLDCRYYPRLFLAGCKYEGYFCHRTS
jgi:hypothetical protein